MKLLVAEDDLLARRVLETNLAAWDYDVVSVGDGLTALEHLLTPDAPPIAILDWMMPGMDGPTVCREIRKQNLQKDPYLILLTANTGKDQIVEGLDAGANDYVTKPYHPRELQARLSVARRISELQSKLTSRVRELEQALNNVKQLEGMLPICCYCKKIRDDSNYWQQVETYIGRHSNAKFSHGICPDCFERVIAEEMKTLK